ncbi:MAG: hypothetical protein LUD27_00745 [Clostridia bacterium]|nr:hypothetical protein [Clostridia bacterium]
MINSEYKTPVFAGTNEFYCYGKNARERIARYLTPDEDGYYRMPVDGGKYYSVGTSTGMYGEYAKWNGTCFSVNSDGILYVKAETEKAKIFTLMLRHYINEMEIVDRKRLANLLDE